MNQTLLETLPRDVPACSLAEEDGLAAFGTPAERVARAVARLVAGGGVIVVDDEDRENEGDMIYAAETLTTPQMARLIREGSGIVCLVLSAERCRALDLPQMVAHNTSSYGTGFTVSIEARTGVTTGVSAADRVTTVRTAASAACTAADLARPGHVFPLAARSGGLAERQGHTEATLDLMVRAGLSPAGVLCEITNPDGTMAKGAQLVAFARRFDMPMVAIADLVAIPA